MDKLEVEMESGKNPEGDGDSDDDSGSEAELQEQIAGLEQALIDSPYKYSSHVELIQLLRQLGDLDRARQARQRMSEVFPLTEGLWLEWIRDELPLSSLPEACTDLRRLFERAVDDYLSVPVWLEYAKFAVEKMSLMLDGMEYPRDIFERGIVSCGLHISQAGVLWNAYREFEIAVLRSLQQMQQADPEDDGLKSQVEEQYERVDKLYKRQLAVPLTGMESTFEEYKMFSEAAVTEESLPAYIQARRKLEECLFFEDELASSAPPTLESYRTYVSHARSHKEDPMFINSLYQRAVAHHPIDTGLWKDYLTFLNQTFPRVSSVLLPAYTQAVRNCPWVVELWSSYTRSQERVCSNHQEIVATFEKGLNGNFTAPKDYLQLWTAFCDYLRRRVDEQDGDGEEEKQRCLVDLRKTFKRARDELETYYGQDGDPTDSLSRFQAGLEARCYGNMEEARILLTDVMSRHGREAEFWLEYAEIERNHGDLSNCRKLLQRSVNSASDEPEKVCQALLRFEREVGTLETFESALERCATQLRRVEDRRKKSSEKEAQPKEEKKKTKKANKAQKKPAAATKAVGEKETEFSSRGAASRQAGYKRRRPQASHVFFDEEEVSELPTKKFKHQVEDSQPTLQLQPQTQRHHGKSEQMGGVAEGEKGRVEEEGGDSGVSESDTSMEVATTPEKQEKRVLMPPPGYKGKLPAAGRERGVDVKVEGDGGRTVFVSNLGHSVTQLQLQERFAECGEITDIRLIKTKGRSGKLNVYAYVEFSSKESMQPALDLDRSEFQGRPLFVSHFREKGEQPTVFKYAETNNLATVFVSNIQHSITEEELKELFKECGELKDVRLVKNRAGRSKGFAYIEYCEEPQAHVAVLKFDNHQMGLKRIKVAISNPPKKPGVALGREVSSGFGSNSAGHHGERRAMEGGVSSGQITTSSFVPPRVLGSGKKTAEPSNPLTRKSKAHVSLLPRVVARKDGGRRGGGRGRGGGEGGGGGGGEGEKSEVQDPKLSNEDFRKMLFNN